MTGTSSLTRYRSSFWPPFATGVPLTTVLAWLFFFALRGRPPGPVDLLLRVAFIVASEALLFLGAIAYFTTDVAGDGIRGFDAFGRRRFVPWDDMGAVKPFNFGGLPYLRVFSADGGAPLWLPLFLEDRAAFDEQVIASAPEKNPVRVFLARRSPPR